MDERANRNASTALCGFGIQFSKLFKLFRAVVEHVSTEAAVRDSRFASAPTACRHVTSPYLQITSDVHTNEKVEFLIIYYKFHTVTIVSFCTRVLPI